MKERLNIQLDQLKISLPFIIKNIKLLGFAKKYLKNG